MNITSEAWLSRPEPVTSSLEHGIPCLTIGTTPGSATRLVLRPGALTPVEQVDFLHALAEEARELAVRVAALHATPVGGVA